MKGGGWVFHNTLSSTSSYLSTSQVYGVAIRTDTAYQSSFTSSLQSGGGRLYGKAKTLQSYFKAFAKQQQGPMVPTGTQLENAGKISFT
mmetsp:Transcript_5704/g.6933  ORF Transcript_5704/g.6933 Transcript_5704/m.6933 type:complete len:89 (-) Transcript_5704:390-656(-)